MRKTPLPPFWENILFTAHVRVYTLRALLLASIVSIPTLVLFGAPAWVSWGGFIAVAGLSVIHQTITGLVLKPSLLLAILDMLFLGLEMIMIIVALVLGLAAAWPLYRDLRREGASNPLTQPWFIAGVLVTLGLSFSFVLRLAAIRRGHGHGLLGGCKPTALLYNRKSIFLNQSIQRPLVRGESMIIRIIRALCISGIVLLVPAFGIYAIILVPSKQQTYLKLQVEVDPIGSLKLGPNADGLVYNATFWIAPLWIPSGDATFLVNWTVTISYPNDASSLTCIGRNVALPVLLTLCDSTGWAWGGFMSLEISLPLGLSGVTVTPMPWSDVVGYTTPSMGTIWDDASFTVVNFATPSEPVLVLRGSYLWGQATWSQEIGLSPSMGSVYTASFYNLQHDTTAALLMNSSNSAALQILSPVGPGPASVRTGYYQQINDKSTISGFSDLGGFWTFVDSTFALLFGANVIYFAFGHRPLSALGVLHIFQRKTLTHNWNEDFPALRTEGGIPGTASAGIVAFIRERLVDLGKAPNPPTVTQELPLVEQQKTNEDAYEAQTWEPATRGSTDSLALKPLRGRDFFRYDSLV